MRPSLLVAALCTILVTLSSVSSQPAAPPVGQSEDQYEPIPPGYDFPADEAAQLRLRDTENVDAMRLHAWNVFAGATQPARGGEAIWETWFQSIDTFATGPQPQGLGARPPRRFTSPRQFAAPGVAQLQAPGASLLAQVMFNKPGHDHIRLQGLNRRAKLTAINNGFAAGTPPERREIAAFPRDAVSLKLVWRVAYADDLTPLRVWDNPLPTETGDPERTWPRVVLVDTTRANIPDGEMQDSSAGDLNSPRSRVVSIERFYHFKIGAAELASVQQVDPRAELGDYAILVAMHLTTKEIPDWIWATYWWHDRPDEGQFASGRPATVNGPWRNYLMDVAYSMETPREYDATPNAVFNPYLEARFESGYASNCMTCHQKSVWPMPPGTAQLPPWLPVTRGARKPDDPLFRTRTKLDFFWSVALESQ